MEREQTRATAIPFIGGKDVMPITGYFGPYPHDYEGLPDYFTDDIFQLISDAGINLMVYSAADYAQEPELVEKNLELGEKYGVGVFVTDSNVIEKRTQETITVEEVADEIKKYSGRKAFCGMYVVDEPESNYYCTGTGDKLISSYGRISEILQKDFNQLCYINALPLANHCAFTVMDVEKTGIPNFINHEFTLQISFDYTMTEVHLGIYINGQLYDNRTFTIGDCRLDAAGSHFALYGEVDGLGTTIGDVSELSEIARPEGYEIIRLHQFVDAAGNQMPPGRHEGSSMGDADDYYVKGLKNFHKKILTFNVRFEGGGYQHSLIFGGTKEWSGFNIHPSIDGEKLMLDCTWADDVNNKAKIGPESRRYYEKYVREICDTMKPKVLCWDFYPFDLIREGKMEYYFYNMDLIRKVAEENKTPFWAFIQAGSQWNDNWKIFESVKPYFPNEEQFNWNVNTSLAFGAKGIQYFPLVQPYQFTLTPEGDYECNGIIGAKGNKTQWYYYAQTVNQHIKAIDKVLMNSTHMGVIASGEQAKKDLEYTSCVISSGSFKQLQNVSGDVLIGCFDYQGQTALYVVNHNYISAQNIKLTFDGVQELKMIRKAKASDVNVSELVLEMAAGEGVLIVIQ